MADDEEVGLLLLMHQIIAQEEEDEFKGYFKGSSDPKILITTTQRAPGVSIHQYDD